MPRKARNDSTTSAESSENSDVDQQKTKSSKEHSTDKAKNVKRPKDRKNEEKTEDYSKRKNENRSNKKPEQKDRHSGKRKDTRVNYGGEFNRETSTRDERRTNGRGRSFSPQAIEMRERGERKINDFDDYSVEILPRKPLLTRIARPCYYGAIFVSVAVSIEVFATGIYILFRKETDFSEKSVHFWRGIIISQMALRSFAIILAPLAVLAGKNGKHNLVFAWVQFESIISALVLIITMVYVFIIEHVERLKANHLFALLLTDNLFATLILKSLLLMLSSRLSEPKAIPMQLSRRQYSSETSSSSRSSRSGRSDSSRTSTSDHGSFHSVDLSPVRKDNRSEDSTKKTPKR